MASRKNNRPYPSMYPNYSTDPRISMNPAYSPEISDKYPNHFYDVRHSHVFQSHQKPRFPRDRHQMNFRQGCQDADHESFKQNNTSSDETNSREKTIIPSQNSTKPAQYRQIKGQIKYPYHGEEFKKKFVAPYEPSQSDYLQKNSMPNSYHKPQLEFNSEINAQYYNYQAPDWQYLPYDPALYYQYPPQFQPQNSDPTAPQPQKQKNSTHKIKKSNHAQTIRNKIQERQKCFEAEQWAQVIYSIEMVLFQQQEGVKQLWHFIERLKGKSRKQKGIIIFEIISLLNCQSIFDQLKEQQKNSKREKSKKVTPIKKILSKLTKPM